MNYTEGQYYLHLKAEILQELFEGENNSMPEHFILVRY